MTRAYLALGSNLGDRLGHLQGALDALARDPDVVVVAASRVYETDPVGGPEQDAYLNAVVAVDTELEPHELLARAHRLEQDAERVRTVRWGPRTLDVDLLMYDDVTIEDDTLTLPHPRMWDRDFVLAPLRDVAPGLVPRDGPWKGVAIAPVALVLRRNS